MRGQPELSEKLERILECSATGGIEIAPNLTRAFVSCLGDEELCDAIVTTLTADPYTRSALIGQLHERARRGLNQSKLDATAADLVRTAMGSPALRVSADTALSHIFPVLSPPTRQTILDMWLGRGTPGASSRWLKAVAGDELLFSVRAVLRYWRNTRDDRAARLLADHAPPKLLSALVPEIIEQDEAGSIVSKAVMRADRVSKASWSRIRHRYPATFIYLCAVLPRPITELEALAIINECEIGWDGTRGIAIWAVGKLKMWAVLESVYASATQEIADHARTMMAYEQARTVPLAILD